MRYAMIMAGGSGTRLWPMSRVERPKQLLPFIIDRGGDAPRSLLEISANRLTDVVDHGRVLVCTQERYRDAVRAALPTLSDDQILGEPVGRDTVNAVGLTAAVLAQRDADATFCVMTADHIIQPVDRFAEIVRAGFDLVDRSPRTLVTFAIEPTFPATGYGYVKRGGAIDGTGGLGSRVERFVEKPDAETARGYLDSGGYGWNSGMFVWRADTFLACLRAFTPEAHAGLSEIAAAWDTPQRRATLERVYPTLPKTSVDYAIMEPATGERTAEVGVNVATLRMDVSWLDVGSWTSYAETLEADDTGNGVAHTAGAGHAVLVDSERNLVVNDEAGHAVALLGCEGLVVVHTPGATLIMPRDKAERLKDLHGRLPAELR
ncbi:MAG: mannose-1-phosphate guanylyltransferase [Planctomycetota bacterium]